MTDISQDPGLGPGLQRPATNLQSLAAPQGRASEFVAVSGAEAENTSATAMLVIAYSLFWLLLLGFVWMTWRRQQSLSSRLRILESQIEKLEIGGSK